MILYGEAPLLQKVLYLLRQASLEARGYFSEQSYADLPLPYLGPYRADILPDQPVLLAFEDNTTRRNLARRLRHPLAPALVAPSPGSVKTVGAGTIILGQATPSAQVDNLVLIEEEAQVGHRVQIGPFSFIGKAVIVESGVLIGGSVYIAAGAVIRSGVAVGTGAIVAPGAIVETDIPPFASVWGAPAQICPPGL